MRSKKESWSYEFDGSDSEIALSFPSSDSISGDSVISSLWGTGRKSVRMSGYWTVHFFPFWFCLSNRRHHAKVAISARIGWSSPTRGYCKRQICFLLVSHWLRFFLHIYYIIYVVPTSWFPISHKNFVRKVFSQKVWYFAFKMLKPLRHTHSRSHRLCLEIPEAFFTGHINVWKPDCKGE